MKSSIYNFLIYDNENNIHLIYNALKNTLIRDNDGKVQNFLKQCREDDLQFRSEYITEAEFNDLLSSGIIVSNETDEKQLAITRNKKRLEVLNKKNEVLSLVITPTLQCNFKCYYCFEKKETRKNEEYISSDVQKDIINFIKMSILKNKIKIINITWYGGEPLIKSEILFSMQKKINELGKFYSIIINSDIVTNGILLLPKTCNILYKHGIKQVQVTIDGPEQIHNKRRYYPVNPANNYNQILENILNSNNNIKFLIRINVDQTNKNFIFDLIDDFIKRKIWPYKKNVFIYTAQVESNKSDFEFTKHEFIDLQDRIRQYLVDKYNEITQTNQAKLNFLYPVLGGEIGCGYGIFKNSWVISYTGDVFRCWESVGQAEYKVGTMKDLLDDFGQSIFEKIKLDPQTFERWGCFDCKFFPICGSNCPWDFVKNKRCTEWKSMLEYRLLNQYKLFLKKPEIFEKTPFNVS